ncbi:MAG: hypothetical protein ACT4PU_11915 [Planctomycetota bacterium]
MQDPEPVTPRLSAWSFGVGLGLSLIIFFALHPLWEPLDMAAMDENILWSYAAIPLLVLGLLAIERKLGWWSWLRETTKLTLVKFGLTFLIANLLWAVVGPPSGVPKPAVEAPPAASEADSRYEPRPGPTPTPLDPAQLGRLRGRVVDAAGQPVAEALVWVSGGLSAALSAGENGGQSGGLPEVVFARPDEAAQIRLDDSGFHPALTLLQTWQELVLRGSEEQLHTVRATDDEGRFLFNLPLHAGSERRIMFDRPMGLVTLACMVHGESETPARLFVQAHSFMARTDDDGDFEFRDVPAGQLECSAQRADADGAAADGAAQASDAVQARSTVSVPAGGVSEDVLIVLR